MNAHPAQLRFKRVSIEGLFGANGPPIDIPFNLGDRLTVLHGRNGSGKTICLSLIHALRYGDIPTLVRYPFERLTVEFAPSTHLVIRRPDPSRIEFDTISFEFEIHEEDGVTRSIQRPVRRRVSREALSAIANRLPWLERLAPNLWLDTETGLQVTLSDLINRYAHRLDTELQGKALGLDQQLAEFLDRLPEVKFIRTDRLFVRGTTTNHALRSHLEQSPHADSVLMVERLSQDLRDEVQQVDREYRLTSTRLDSSLRRRLFEKPENPPTLAELKTGNRALDEQERNLQDMGLLREAPDSVDADAISETDRDQHAILLQDRKEKLAVFSTIMAKAQRLLESLNKKLAPKKVRLNVEEGYQVLLPDGRALPLESLSSGEQHELVLLHELLFDVPKGSLILIDEPELSLHVTWQTDLLPELIDIARLADLDFVLATHSPYIVGDRDDLMVRLGEPV